MKEDGKETLRSIRGLREIIENVVKDLSNPNKADRKLELDRAELIIDAGNTLLKTCVAEMAWERHKLDMQKKGLKVIEHGDQVGEDNGGEGGEEAAAEGSAEVGKAALEGKESSHLPQEIP